MKNGDCQNNVTQNRPKVVAYVDGNWNKIDTSKMSHSLLKWALSQSNSPNQAKVILYMDTYIYICSENSVAAVYMHASGVCMFLQCIHLHVGYPSIQNFGLFWLGFEINAHIIGIYKYGSKQSNLKHMTINSPFDEKYVYKIS